MLLARRPRQYSTCMATSLNSSSKANDCRSGHVTWSKSPRWDLVKSSTADRHGHKRHKVKMARTSILLYLSSGGSLFKAMQLNSWPSVVSGPLAAGIARRLVCALSRSQMTHALTSHWWFVIIRSGHSTRFTSRAIWTVTVAPPTFVQKFQKRPHLVGRRSTDLHVNLSVSRQIVRRRRYTAAIYRILYAKWSIGRMKTPTTRRNIFGRRK